MLHTDMKGMPENQGSNGKRSWGHDWNYLLQALGWEDSYW